MSVLNFGLFRIGLVSMVIISIGFNIIVVIRGYLRFGEFRFRGFADGFLFFNKGSGFWGFRLDKDDLN